MKEPLVSAPGPICELLDDFARMPERKRTVIAGVLSLVLHAFVFIGGGLAIFSLNKNHAQSLTKEPEKKQLEVILLTPTPPPSSALSAATPTPPPEQKPEELSKQEEALLEEKFRLLPEETQREYVDVDGLARKKNLSKRALMDSWTDSVAGSRLPGKGENSLPTRSGRGLPFASFKEQQANLGTAAKSELENRPPQLPLAPSEQRPIFQPQPISRNELSPTVKARPIPRVAEVAKLQPKEMTRASTPAPSRLLLAGAATPPPLKKVREANNDEIAMFLNKPEQKKSSDLSLRPEPTPEPVKPKPTPEPKEPEPTPEPVMPKSAPEQKSMIVAARPQAAQSPASPPQVQTQIQGGNAAPGEDGVDAIATVAGKYKKSLNSTIGSRWTHYIHSSENAGRYSAGETTVLITIDARGKIVRMKTIENSSNSAHVELCERAVFESQRDFEPPPTEVLKNGIYESSFSFLLL